MMPIRCFRLISAVSILCFLMMFQPASVGAVSTSASSAVLMDADSGRILYAHNENARMLIASTTKIMTALVAIENACLTDVVTVKRNATLVEGTSMYLKEGERLTLETLLYGLLLSSGNDAAVAVAEGVSGSVSGFVALMNGKATELGMTNTSFANPHGLDAPDHYSTALDMARLACAAMDNATLMRIASTKSVSAGGRSMSNHNRLLNTVDGCLGLKTGYTRAAGRTLVSCVQRNGRRLVAVTLQDGNDWADHAALFDYGFSEYTHEQIFCRGQQVGSLPVTGGLVTSVPIVTSCGLAWPVKACEDLSVRCELPEDLGAPLAAGQTVGRAVLLLDGIEVAETELVCGATVLPALPEPMTLFRRLMAGLKD